MMILQNLKVSRALDVKPCATCSKNCIHRRSPAPRQDAVNLMLRYLHDGEEIVDTVEGRVLIRGDEGYEAARVQANAVDALIAKSPRRRGAYSTSGRVPKTVQGVKAVMEKSRALLEYLDKTTPEQKDVLDDLFEFEDQKFRSRLPPLVREHLGLV